MWKVVGFKSRVKNEKTYWDVFVSRPCTGGQGEEVRVLNYSQDYIGYLPALGDMIMFSMGSYNGRQYVQEINKV